MTSNNLQAAVSAGVLSAEGEHRSLLQSIVEVARAIFSAKAASIFLHDEETDELVFEAVAGEGSDSLVGMRFPSSTGIAGWTLVTRQPLVIEELREDPRFSRERAESTGYVPEAMMSVPLLHGEHAVGVLQVLDRSQAVEFSLGHMELLGLFANQAAIALDLLQRARHARSVLTESGGEAGVIARVASALEDLDEAQREPAMRLLAALDDFLRALTVRPVLVGNVYDPSFGDDRNNFLGVDPALARRNHGRMNAALAELGRRYGAAVDLHGHFLTGDPAWFTRTIEPSLVGASEVRRAFLPSVLEILS
jgi:hypothetical protein